MNIIEDKRYLKTTDDIDAYFKEDGYEHFECGQGYSQDKATVIVKIDQLYYKVEIEAEIGSAKQDHGDRLYWVEDISNVTYEEIAKETVMNNESIRLWKIIQMAKLGLEKAENDLSLHLYHNED